MLDCTHEWQRISDGWIDFALEGTWWCGLCGAIKTTYCDYEDDDKPKTIVMRPACHVQQENHDD